MQYKLDENASKSWYPSNRQNCFRIGLPKIWPRHATSTMRNGTVSNTTCPSKRSAMMKRSRGTRSVRSTLEIGLGIDLQSVRNRVNRREYTWELISKNSRLLELIHVRIYFQKLTSITKNSRLLESARMVDWLDQKTMNESNKSPKDQRACTRGTPPSLAQRISLVNVFLIHVNFLIDVRKREKSTWEKWTIHVKEKLTSISSIKI